MTARLAIENMLRALRYLMTHGHWCHHGNMGDWWPCNFGADEVRMCATCDRVEKREMAVNKNIS